MLKFHRRVNHATNIYKASGPSQKSGEILPNLFSDSSPIMNESCRTIAEQLAQEGILYLICDFGLTLVTLDSSLS